jgi:hypothetical protein
MKNDLESIRLRAQEIVRELMDGIPLSLYDAEMEVLDKLIDELLVSMDFDASYNPIPRKDFKKALMNMYFLGKNTWKINN